jgi:hypothetical protein
MDRHARERQQRYRNRRKEAGFHRLEVWIPADVMAEIDRRHKPYGDFCRPALALIALARRALRLPRPLEPWERDRNNQPP